jgi:hypothetical protein
MSRSDKRTMTQRVQDVLRLLLSGFEFAEIRQFALAQGWNVTDRQIRRYQEAAYRDVAKIVRRDQVQLLGRHLMQRRALYAHALKNQDFRTALQILRDEAHLQGLYPSANGCRPGRQGAVEISDPPRAEAISMISYSEVRQQMLADPKLLEALRIVELQEGHEDEKGHTKPSLAGPDQMRSSRS